MLTFWNYLSGMWVVVVACVTVPENWEQCKKVDEWLIPEIQRGYDIWSGKETIYQEEKDYLGGLDSPQSGTR